MPTAGIVVIGNEILSGKVVATNSPFLCQELRELGVAVERLDELTEQTASCELQARSSQRFRASPSKTDAI